MAALEKTHCEPSYQNLLSRIEALEERIENTGRSDEICLVIFSGDLDRLLAAFNIAVTAAALGIKPKLFFTFWGNSTLKQHSQFSGKTWVEKAFTALLPGGPEKRALSKLHFAGMGRWLMAREMKKKNVANVSELIETCGDLGVEFYICEMTSELMGIKDSEYLRYPHLHQCGAAQFLDMSARANTTLFI